MACKLRHHVQITVSCYDRKTTIICQPFHYQNNRCWQHWAVYTYVYIFTLSCSATLWKQQHKTMPDFKSCLPPLDWNTCFDTQLTKIWKVTSVLYTYTCGMWDLFSPWNWSSFGCNSGHTDKNELADWTKCQTDIGSWSACTASAMNRCSQWFKAQILQILGIFQADLDGVKCILSLLLGDISHSSYRQSSSIRIIHLVALPL